MGVRGRVAAVAANTSVDAMRSAPGGEGVAAVAAIGLAVVTMHRVENLYQRLVVLRLVDAMIALAARQPVRFAVHGPTWEALRRGGHDHGLRTAGVELSPLVAHHDFVAMLRAAPLVITGGSIQEEWALLGVPTLAWRRRTERSDGVGANVVVSAHDPSVERPSWLTSSATAAPRRCPTAPPRPTRCAGDRARLGHRARTRRSAPVTVRRWIIGAGPRCSSASSPSCSSPG